MKRIHWSWLTVALLSLACVSAVADDWQEWRGPNRNGVSTETNWLASWPPDVVWTARVERGCGSVAVYDGRVYVAAQDTNAVEEVVYCFNARTGEQVWRNTYSLPLGNLYGNMATPAVNADKVYTFTHENRVLIWDRFTGARLWDHKSDTSYPLDGAGASPLVIGDRVIFNAGSSGSAIRKMMPFDPIWGDELDSGTNSGYSSPVPITIGPTQYVAIVNGASILNIVPVDGDMDTKPVISVDLHRVDIDAGTVHSDPIVYGSQIYVCGSAGPAMLGIIGEPIWDVVPIWTSNMQHMVCQYMNCVIVGNYIYGARFAPYYDGAWDWHGAIACISAADGTTQWEREFPDEGLTAISTRPSLQLVAVDDRIVMLHEDGKMNIMKASPTSFDLEGRNWITPFSYNDHEGEFTTPVVADGLLYCRSMNGELICYQIGPTNTVPDNDGDGLPDTWEQRHFLSRNSCVPGDDSDGDGLSNEDEFTVGTAPTNDASALRAKIALSNGKILVSCDSKAARGVEYGGKDRCYTLEAKTNLLNGAWQQVTGFIDVVGSDATIVHTNNAPVPSNFYRIKAKLKLP
ncbi:PQQ-binding-like beta-propeller repeat protein [Verrucomicrobiota bacterium]